MPNLKEKRSSRLDNKRSNKSSAQSKKRLRTQRSQNTSQKPWGGRFSEKTHSLVERFTSSLSFDRRLFEQDIQGSIAHCKTLERAKVLTRKECGTIIQGLETIQKEIQKGRFSFSASDEDIHMAIEGRLTKLIGPLGGKLHTGRSRNDQITLDLRLYLRQALHTLSSKLQKLEQSLLWQARENLDVIMPGYTHLQRAQPVLVAHHFLAYVEMLERDQGRVHDAFTRVNIMPLGSGALAGTNYPLDRLYTAKLLGFPEVCQNSLDAVSDRDYVVEALSTLALIMMHLSRLSEELVLWTSQEFQFVSLPDGFCTGSSMMPQKKNPDIPELIRGKTGRVYGHLMAVLTTLKGLPLTYNRDLQEDKEPLFDVIDTVFDCLDLYTELVRRLHVCPEAMANGVNSGFLLATDLADYLVGKGLPFREAHGIVGQLVRMCIQRRYELRDLTFSDLRAVSPYFGRDALKVLTLKGSIDRKAQIGGTASKQVAKRLKALEKILLERVHSTMSYASR